MERERERDKRGREREKERGRKRKNKNERETPLFASVVVTLVSVDSTVLGRKRDEREKRGDRGESFY